MYQRKNFAYGKVATAPSPAASGTTLVLETGQGARFPNTSGGTYVCVVKQTNLPATPDIAEVVLVTSHDPANDNFTITREQEGSSARTIIIGDEFYLSPTDGVWDQIDKLTTKGDLLGFDTAYARVPVGTNDQVLTADSTEDLGVAWKSVGAVSNTRNEVPSGTVNGTNTDFTIANTPVTGTLRVYVNGVRQKVTDDYTLSGTTITFVSAPLTDSKLLVDYETNAGTYATGSADFVNNETPSGLVNGSNTSFTLANTPVSGTLHLLRDGQEIYETNDWTISGATITMVAAPVTGSVIRANYQKTVSTAGNADLLDGQHGTYYENLAKNSPRGHLINGKIVPSVASNNLTLALKGMDGNDPSATNPVYCRIGDTVRSITAALSVTTNAGTNWFNSGSADLAAQEIDYFVYLGYNATDGVVIGFSRIPYVNEYSQFSATSTNEKYCAISTITNAASGDDYEVVGRFAATLSASASYNWSVPTFTNINLIQKPIFETRWINWNLAVDTATIDNGSGGQPTMEVKEYKIRFDDLSYRTKINTAYKAGAGNRINFSTKPFGTSISNEAIGVVMYDTGVVWVQGFANHLTGIVCSFDFSITDNQTIAVLSNKGSYKI